MPGARTHDFITIVTAAVGVPAALDAGLPDLGPTNAIVLLSSYLASGLMFSPDLDLHSSPYRRWRKLRWIWLPYQRLVPHRSWISHSLLIGPFLRVLYFAGVMSLLSLVALGLLNLIVPVDPTGTILNVTAAIGSWVQAHPATLGYAVLGFFLGAAAHTIADVVTTALKRRF